MTTSHDASTDHDSLPVAKRGCILLLTEGDVTDLRFHSGGNHHLYLAPTAHCDVLAADMRFRGWRRYANALYAFSILPLKVARDLSRQLGGVWGKKTRLCEAEILSKTVWPEDTCCFLVGEE